MKFTHVTAAALTAILSAPFASQVSATPITYVFTGHVTDIFIADRDGNVFTDDPYTSATVNGAPLVNGNPYVVGSYTFDSELSEWYGGRSSSWPAPVDNLTYQFSTEGISFNKTSGLYTFDSFVNDEGSVSSHIETSTVKNSGPLWWNYQNFDFEFDAGKFIDGSFDLYSDQMPSGFSPSYFMSGVIDNVFVVAAPEPPALSLLLAGVFGMLFYRRRHSKI